MVGSPPSPAKLCAPRSACPYHQADLSSRRPGPPAPRCPWSPGSGGSPWLRAPREHRGLAARSSRPPPAASWPSQASRPRGKHSARGPSRPTADKDSPAGPAPHHKPTKPRPPPRAPACLTHRSPHASCRRGNPPPGPTDAAWTSSHSQSGRLGRKEEERQQLLDPDRRGPLLNSRGPPSPPAATARSVRPEPGAKMAAATRAGPARAPPQRACLRGARARPPKAGTPVLHDLRLAECLCVPRAPPPSSVLCADLSCAWDRNITRTVTCCLELTPKVEKAWP